MPLKAAHHKNFWRVSGWACTISDKQGGEGGGGAVGTEGFCQDCDGPGSTAPAQGFDGRCSDQQLSATAEHMQLPSEDPVRGKEDATYSQNLSFKTRKLSCLQI
jgi:hypothetical protein